MYERKNYTVRVFTSRGMETNCYLIITPKGNIVIDPCVEYKLLEKYGKIDNVLLTHGHFDHFNKIESYFNKGIVFSMHHHCLEKIKDPEKNMSMQFGKPISFEMNNEKCLMISNRDILKLHDLEIKTILTNGHTDCCITYILDDLMFTGDFLFKGSIGRTDMYSSNISKMLNSLNMILREMKNDYIILPGHGERSTLDVERKTNIFLSRYTNGGNYEHPQR